MYSNFINRDRRGRQVFSGSFANKHSLPSISRWTNNSWNPLAHVGWVPRDGWWEWCRQEDRGTPDIYGPPPLQPPLPPPSPLLLPPSSLPMAWSLGGSWLVSNRGTPVELRGTRLTWLMSPRHSPPVRRSGSHGKASLFYLHCFILHLKSLAIALKTNFHLQMECKMY